MSVPRLARIVAIALLAISSAQLSEAADLTLGWDAPSDGMTTGFVLYYGTTSHTYTQQVNVGPATSYTVSSLSAGTTYYFAVRGYTANGAMSDFSTEVSATTDRSTVATLGLTSNVPSPQPVGASVAWSAA